MPRALVSFISHLATDKATIFAAVRIKGASHVTVAVAALPLGFGSIPKACLRCAANNKDHDEGTLPCFFNYRRHALA